MESFYMYMVENGFMTIEEVPEPYRSKLWPPSQPTPDQKEDEEMELLSE